MCADTDRSQTSVRVWDLPTRVFHGAIIGLVAFLWWSEKTDDIADHKLAGFALIALIVFRLFWGLVGSETARFSNFVRGPRAMWRYLAGRAPQALGHNPIGGLSVLLILFLLTTESLLGLFAVDEDGLESGPLAPIVGLDWAQLAAHWHAILFDVLIGVIGLHVGAVLLYWLAGKNLITPMITGRKNARDAKQPPAFASRWLTLVGIALASACFVWLWRLDGH